MRHPTSGLLLLLLLLFPDPCPAATWIGGGDPLSWDDAANWEGGAAPADGETIVLRPAEGAPTVIGLGRGNEAAPLDLILDTSRPLTLALAEGSSLGTVRTLAGGYHHLSGAALGGSSQWNLAAGSVVTLERLAAWSEIELVSGDGFLVIGPQDGQGVVPATIVIRSGGVAFDDSMGPSHDGIEMVMAGGNIGFTWDLGRLGALRIEDGQGGVDGWGAVQVGQLTVRGSGDRDLRQFPTLRSPETQLRVVGILTLGDNLETDRVVAEVGELDLGGGARSFDLRLEAGRVVNGSLEGGVRVIAGTLACATTGDIEVLEGALGGEGLSVAGTLRAEGALVSGDIALSGALLLGGLTTFWDGQLALAEGARVAWKPDDSGGTVVELRGMWALAGDTLLSVGETDWSSPYWDANREVRLVDMWDSSAISGTFVLESAAKGDEGFWSLGQAEDGDLMLAWTALGAAPIPEAPGRALGAAALLVALSARRRRARPQ